MHRTLSSPRIPRGPPLSLFFSLSSRALPRVDSRTDIKSRLETPNGNEISLDSLEREKATARARAPPQPFIFRSGRHARAKTERLVRRIAPSACARAFLCKQRRCAPAYIYIRTEESTEYQLREKPIVRPSASRMRRDPRCSQQQGRATPLSWILPDSPPLGDQCSVTEAESLSLTRSKCGCKCRVRIQSPRETGREGYANPL